MKIVCDEPDADTVRKLFIAEFNIFLGRGRSVFKDYPVGGNTAADKLPPHTFGFADVLIDNCGDKGDASVEVAGVPEKCGPTSTVIGAMILNAVVVRAVELLTERGIEPPVFISANIDGGDEHNARILEEYKDNIFYM